MRAEQFARSPSPDDLAAVAVDHAIDLIEGRTSSSIAQVGRSEDSQLEPVFNPPRKSEIETRRAEGVKTFEAAVIECAKRADEVDKLWDRYVNACFGQKTTGSASGTTQGGVYDKWGRQWFSYDGVWTGNVSINNEGTPQCRGWIADIRHLATDIYTIMTSAEKQAHSASVYPGTRRDLRRKYRMEWKGWGR